MAIGASALYSATSVTALAGERLFFGAVLAIAAMLALMTVAPRLEPRASTLAVLWVLFAVLYLAASLLQISWSGNYVVGDLAVALMPLFVMLAFVAHPVWLQSRAGLVLLLVSLGVAAVEARLIGMLGARHGAPSALLIAGVWYFALQARTWRIRVSMLVITVAVGWLAYSSGYRTHLILWAVAPVIIMAVLRGWRPMLKAITAIGMIWAAAALAGMEIDPLDSFSDSRFETIISGSPDESLQSRFSELRDVRTTIAREWLPGQHLLGYGFGATYEPQRSFIEANVGADGRVHSIHFGPALVLFRFGLIGLVIFGSMLVLVWRVLRDVRHDQAGPGSRDVVAVLALALALFSLEFLVLNPTVQPAMSYCLGGLLASRVQRESAPHPRIGVR